MSAVLTLSALAASFGARPLFSDLDAVVAPGDVVAVVGRNGAGKSTLLRIIAGLHSPDAGTVAVSPPGSAVGFLAQEGPRTDETITEFAARRTGVAAATAAYRTALDDLSEGRPGADDAYATAFDTWLALGGADLEARLPAVLARVGLDVEPDRPLGTLSPGQAARAGLASILVSSFDVLLLDEPTNNLDAAGIGLITDFVRGFSGSVLIASHDRAFMDAVATSVLALDPVQQRVALYAGGWSSYREAADLDRRHAREAYESYADQRDALVAQARRQSDWAAKGRSRIDRVVKERGTPRVDRKWAEDKAKRMDQRAARTRAAADRLEPVDAPRKEWDLRYSIRQAPPSADVVLTLDRVKARAGSFSVGPVSAQVARGDRVALVGPNGSGKSTLLSAILGGEASEGRIQWGSRTAIGVIDQGRTLASGPRSVVEIVTEQTGLTGGEARTLLAKFGMASEHVDRPADTLSLGERTRACLALLSARAVNVLVLDEPTNHADVEAIEQLQGALASFDGTLIVITHDAALLDALGVNLTWTCVREGESARVLARA